MQSISVIIPTLNEESSIEKVIKKIPKTVLGNPVEILVIDGGSKDKTLDIAKKLGVTTILQKRKGKGMAMREAVEYTQTEIIVFIDGDGTYSSNDLTSLIQPILDDHADMVVGSRISGQMEKGSISTLNMIGNKLFNKTINFALKSKVTDSLTGYRALRRKVFLDLVLFSNNFEIEVEMTVEALAKGYRINEIPINYINRKDSETKLNPTSDGIKIFQTLLFITMNVNPLKFFGLIALGFILIGIIPASQVLYEKIFLNEVESMPSLILTTLLFVSGALSLVLGFVSELIVRSRRRLEYIISKKE